MALQTHYPFYLANKAMSPNHDLAVADKYSGEPVTHVAFADANAIDQAISAAVAAEPAMAALAPYERQAILQHCVAAFGQCQEELAEALCIEAGKPIHDSRGEVTRLIDTFRVAAEEAVRINGEVQNLEISARAKGYFGMFRRVPLGACAFISPFNFPLNLVAHKIAPAIAAACPFVLKPASLTPVGALLIGKVLAQTDLPPGAFSILPCRRESASVLATDERLKLLSFTGSSTVGWELKRLAGKKQVVLELGGNAACVVDRDWDVEDAVSRLVTGAFYQSGQSCISVQRIMVHADIYDELKALLTAKTKALVMGNPRDEKTFIGPMIAVEEAQRLEQWINEARAAGATLLCGGGREGAMLEASLLENVPVHLPLCTDEAFGPVALLSKFTDFDQVLDEVNASVFGLQAGIFTRDIYKAHKAWERLQVGGVVIGDVPSFRVDNMPYGGVKDSGLGREGIRFAIADMTTIRNLVIRNPELQLPEA